MSKKNCNFARFLCAKVFPYARIDENNICFFGHQEHPESQEYPEAKHKKI